MGISLPLLMIGVGVFLIALFIIITILKKLLGSRDDRQGPDNPNQPPGSQIHNLQQRISSLQQQSQAGSLPPTPPPAGGPRPTPLKPVVQTPKVTPPTQYTPQPTPVVRPTLPNQPGQTVYRRPQ